MVICLQKSTIFELLYSSFPRQVAIPYRITVKNPDEFYTIINKNKEKKRVFASIYNFTGAHEYDKAFLNVDKIFFDFDGESAYKDMRRFVRHLLVARLRFLVLYSGGGFHVYVFTDNGSSLKDIKGTITSVQRYFKKKLDLRSLDEKVIGDYARVATIPLTWNHRRHRYCIPLTLNDLIRGEKYIHEKARKQTNPLDYKVYGCRNINLADFDVNGRHHSHYTSVCGCKFCDIFEYSKDIKLEIDHDKILHQFPPCVSALLINGRKVRVGWSARYLIIVYMRDSGIPLEDANEIIARYLINVKRGKTEAYHCIVEEKQTEKIYKLNSTATFPCCERVKDNGYCPVDDFCQFTRKYGSLNVIKIYK